MLSEDIGNRHRRMGHYNIELNKNKIEKLNIKNPCKIYSYKMKNNSYQKTIPTNTHGHCIGTCYINIW